MVTNQQKLKLILKFSGLSQEKLAQQLGISFASLNSWINERSIPRAKAQTRINELYAEYTGQKIIPASELEAKKAALRTLQSQHLRILDTLLHRKDLYDEFMLELTYHSNKIEGSKVTKPDTAAILFDNVTLPDRTLIEQLEVKNHQTALVYLLDYLNGDGKLDEKLILTLHSKLMNGIVPNAGIYRYHNVRIGGSNVPTSNYLKVPELIKTFAGKFSRGGDDIIAHLAVTHAEFEQIHPFSDGNGRIGRLLMHALALRADFPPVIIRQERRQVYYFDLNKAQTKGDTSLLEDLVCEGILESYKIIESAS